MNKVADALSRRATLLVTVEAQVTSFESLKERYADDPNFQKVWELCCNHRDAGDFLIQDGFLFKAGRLCIP